jgi:hypothetical protein
MHFEFLYVDQHFNLPLLTGALPMLVLCALVFVRVIQTAEKAMRFVKMTVIVWALFALAAMVAAIAIEQSFSPFAQLQARYHPPIISAILGTAMVLLVRFRISDRQWASPATMFILISLRAAQAVADLAATHRWNSYVQDLQSRLAMGRGLIPWETTVRTETNLQTKIGGYLKSDGLCHIPASFLRRTVS